jgi:hypothetical protein
VPQGGHSSLQERWTQTPSTCYNGVCEEEEESKVTENEEVEQEIKDIIYRTLHVEMDVDATYAGEVTNDLYDELWEYFKDFD